MLMSVTISSAFADVLKQDPGACKAAAVAELVNRVSGSNYKPKDFYTNSNGSCRNVNGVKYGNYTCEYKTDNSGVSRSAQQSKIDDSLARGLPIVVQTSPGNPHHWVIILRREGTTYWIGDPSDGKEKRLDSRYTLGAHGDYGYVCMNGGSAATTTTTRATTTTTRATTTTTRATTTTTTTTRATTTTAIAPPETPSATYFPKYTGTSVSISDAMKEVGAENSLEYRKTVAPVNNIANYTGTAAQNTQMLNLLKDGKLRRPTAGAAVTTAATTTTRAPSSVTYFPKYTGTSVSISDAMKEVGAQNSLEYRKTVAPVNNISNYTGTAAQNTQMLNLLKDGKLIKP